MRLCIPTDDDSGLDAPIAGHFGSAPYFTLVDSDTGTVEVVPNHHAHHRPGTCASADDLPARGVGAVLCVGLGRRALGRLQESGIAVFVTAAGSAGPAVEAFRAGRVVPLARESACHGGGHGHGCT
jgi:predicted Fe-Mo cluster-binding NifX family protein